MAPDQSDFRKAGVEDDVMDAGDAPRRTSGSS
jgi:hypothetical protein